MTQLYENFNLLNYLNFHQRVDMIDDLSYQDSIEFHGNLPRFINDKVFKLRNGDKYFLLRESRIPTAQELICHRIERPGDKRIESKEYK